MLGIAKSKHGLKYLGVLPKRGQEEAGNSFILLFASF
jgi:hypothetical protein